MLPEFGWTELLLIAIVLIVVVGPKDLPRVVRGFSKSLGSMRKMAGDFRKQFDDALSEAELDDLKTIAKDVKGMDPRNQIKDALNPLGEIGKDINDELKGVAKSIEADMDSSAPAVKQRAVPDQTPAKASAKKSTSKKPTAKKPATKRATAKAATSKASAAKTTAPASKTTRAKSSTSSKTSTAKATATKTTRAKASPKSGAVTQKPASKSPTAARKPATKRAAATKKPAASRAGKA